MGEEIMVFLVILAICATICILRALRLKYRHDKRYDSDDTRTMQEISRGLQRMDGRIEALETLLMDRPRGRRPQHDYEEGARR